MSARIGLLAIAALGALLAACGTAANQDALVVGNQYEGVITVGSGGTQVPLPEGKWRLVDTHLDGGEISGILVRSKQRRVSQLIDFNTLSQPPESKGPIKWPQSYDFCSRKDFIYMGKSESANTLWNTGPGRDTQDCWGINHWPMTFSGSIPTQLLALRDYVEKNNLELPITMIAVQYRRSGQRKFMSMNYYFNPELEGFAPPERAEWRTNDWHRDRYSLDPKKKAYIENLIRWGAEWHAQVDRGFRGILKRGGP